MIPLIALLQGETMAFNGWVLRWHAGRLERRIVDIDPDSGDTVFRWRRAETLSAAALLPALIGDGEDALAQAGSDSLQAFFAECHQTAVEKGWHDGADWTAPDKQLAGLALIHSEVSEACEDVRVGNLEPGVNEAGKPVGLASELADIVIRVADMAGAMGIDLADALRRKAAYNKTRAHRHGGKLA